MHQVNKPDEELIGYHVDTGHSLELLQHLKFNVELQLEVNTAVRDEFKQGVQHVPRLGLEGSRYKLG